MPDTDTIPVSASIASTGTGIRYIGDWAFALSGIIGVTGSETTLLEFNSGAGLISGVFQNYRGTGDNLGNDYVWRLYFNDTQINEAYDSTVSDDTGRELITKIIIPPLTTVKVTTINVTGAASNNCSCVFTGRVYGDK